MIDSAINELNKFYGSNHVIKGISLEIYNGEKAETTLFKTITADEHYESGKNKTKLSSQSPKSVSIETLIIETESEINKANAEIEADLLKADFSKMNELHEKKNQLAERIDVLYTEWLEGGF